jgi:hypothetical protein
MHTKDLAVDLLSDDSNSVVKRFVSVNSRAGFVHYSFWLNKTFLAPFIWLLGCKTCHVCLHSRGTLFIDAGSVAVDYR